jgi:hypothetical protein
MSAQFLENLFIVQFIPLKVARTVLPFPYEHKGRTDILVRKCETKSAESAREKDERTITIAAEGTPS